MSEMIKKMARAMEAAALDRNASIGHARELTEAMALAALKAMREPTGTMIDAGVDEYGEYGFGPHYAGRIFTAMIDVVIKEASG